MRPDSREANDIKRGCLWFFLIVLAAAVVFVAGYYLFGGSELDDYCFNRMYNQGFRGEDLEVMITSCIQNPGPGAP